MPDAIHIHSGKVAGFSNRLDRVFEWMQRREAALVLLGIALQFAVLGSMLFSRAKPLLTGETVLLRVVPVDPRDMFRGEYVILSYDFSRTLPPEVESSSRETYWQGVPVYAHLEKDPDGEHWSVSEVTLEPPVGSLYLRGTIVGEHRVEYGIESYFVQEGRGKEIEEEIGKGQVSAEVAVEPDGTAVLSGLRLP